MTQAFGWNEMYEIAYQLGETHPDVDPLTISFPTLLQWIVSLEGFTGDPKKSNETRLEAIQMAWLEEYKSR